MILLVEMVKDKDLVLRHELQKTDAVFLNQPGYELFDTLFLQLKNMVALLVFAVQDLCYHFSLCLTLEKLLHF